jgi:hypothetical protein
MSGRRKYEQNRGNDRSRPGWPFTEIPGNGGGEQVIPDPNGSRAQRRKAKRREKQEDSR